MKRKIVAVLAFVLLFYLSFLNYTDLTQVGLARNWFNGKMWLQERGGWHVSAPWVWVTRIDTRPMRVAITSAGRGYSAKLVQFNPQAWREFVQTEGWYYYWWYNRFSFNFGYREEYRGMRDIMRGYAYGVKRYSFITIIEEYQTE
jgi:hypothetical protein